MRLPAAILWDLDGTLIDSEPRWKSEQSKIAKEFGIDWTEQDGLGLVGSALLDSGRYISDRLDGRMTPEQVVDRQVGRIADSLRVDIPWQAGARELFAEAHAACIKQALVTMSYRVIAEPVVAQLAFDAVVTGDEVNQGKPDPEPYLRAAQLLGVRPQDCLAVEDSKTGTASADAAGALVLVVPHLVEVPKSPRRVFRDGLAGIDLSEVAELWTAYQDRSAVSDSAPSDA